MPSIIPYTPFFLNYIHISRYTPSLFLYSIRFSVKGFFPLSVELFPKGRGLVTPPLESTDTQTTCLTLFAYFVGQAKGFPFDLLSRAKYTRFARLRPHALILLGTSYGPRCATGIILFFMRSFSECGSWSSRLRDGAAHRPHLPLQNGAEGYVAHNALLRP